MSSAQPLECYPNVPNVPSASGPPSIEPLTSSDRIVTVDVLRGMAVLGILLINIQDFALPHADKSAAGTEWVGVYAPVLADRFARIAWVGFNALFEGKMRAIFSMLFGAGAVLLTSRLQRRGAADPAADIYYRRTLWLLLFGVLHAYLLWEGDILFSYAVSGLFLYPFRNVSARRLIALGLLVLALSVPRAALLASHRQQLSAQAQQAALDERAGKTLDAKQIDARDDWEEVMDTFRPSADALRDAGAPYHGGYFGLFARRAQLVRQVESSDYYEWAFADSIGMMLIGMGLLRSGVLTAQRRPRVYARMAALGFGLGLPFSAGVSYLSYWKRFDPVAIAWLTAAYEPGRLAVALGYIGAVMLLLQAGRCRLVAGQLAAVGRMALTNYLGATLICTTLFNGYGFGLFGSVRRPWLLLVVAAVWGVQIVFSRAWLARFQFGPMEWLWRSLTYWKRQPWRRPASP